ARSTCGNQSPQPDTVSASRTAQRGACRRKWDQRYRIGTISTIIAPCWEAAGAALPNPVPVAAHAALPAAHPVAAAAPAQPVAGPTVPAAATAPSWPPEAGERPVPAVATPAPQY